MSQFFKNIIGHQKQLLLLQDDLEKDNLAHAYLLAGPSDLGKFTIAKSFAKAVQTKDLSEEKIFQLSTLIDRGIHPDTIVYPAKAGEDSIKIDEVRTLLNNLQMTGDSWKRILVLENIDRLTDEAANAMLKMLEEPPNKVLFVFTTSNPKMVFETIISRVRRIDFQLTPANELFHALKNRYRLVEEAKISRVVELALGRVAKAIKLLETDEHLKAYEDIYVQIQDFLERRDIASAFTFVSQIHNDSILIQIFLEIASIVLRNEMKAAVQSGNSDAVTLASERLDKLFEVKRISETNTNSRLLLENFILSL
jgi:DNA polymerase III delta prime subunit